MTVRNKLFLMMSFVICCMALVFFVLANNYLGNLFKQYGQTARSGSAEQVARLLSYYYQNHGDTWVGVDSYANGFFQPRGSTGRSPTDRAPRPEYVVVFDVNHHVVSKIAPPGMQVPSDVSSLRANGGVDVPITSDGKTVGTLWIRDRGVQGLFSVQQRVLRTITLSTLWGAIVTGAIALVISAWFARRVTLPLRHMKQAIQRISGGDLSTRIPVESGDEFGMVAAALNDMTERLYRTEEARKHLVADVAHELRTPLTIVRGQLELFQQGVKHPEPQTLLPIYDEVLRLHRLVEDLHELSLAEAGKLPLEKVPVDIVQLVARVVDNFQWEAEERNIHLSLHLEDHKPISVDVDPNRMTQVFVNLVGNAMRYTPSDGHVNVLLMCSATDVTIEVHNTGPGIPEDHLPFIFDRFYRAGDDRSRRTGGMGLGLSIAKEFVEAHGGQIRVESDPKRGTSFVVSLSVAGSTREALTSTTSPQLRNVNSKSN